jgi:hypothetical protein
MKFEPVSGSEMQIDSINCHLHEGDDIDARLDGLRSKLQQVYDKEFGHKVIRISYRDGKTTIFVNAGFEENLYNDVVDYIRNCLRSGRYPYVFTLHNFLSFSPLRDVNSDNA